MPLEFTHVASIFEQKRCFGASSGLTESGARIETWCCGMVAPAQEFNTQRFKDSQKDGDDPTSGVAGDDVAPPWRCGQPR